MSRPEHLQLGTWISSGSAVVTEVAGSCGVDWVLIDLEHGSGTEADVPDQLRALKGTRTLPIVRIGAPRPEVIARVLDWGARGIMVPHVNSAEEATACVQAMRYPPLGHRGVSRSVRAYDFGKTKFPGNASDSRPLFLAQIETIEGVEHAEEIANVDGVDVLFVGPADLQFDLSARPERAQDSFETCLEKVHTAAVSAGKSCGLLVRDPGQLEGFINSGWTWPAMDSDLGLLRTAFASLSTTADQLRITSPAP